MKYGLPPLPVDLLKLLEEIENEYVEEALGRGIDKEGTAKLLGMNRTTLYMRLKRRAEDGKRHAPYRKKT